MYLAGLIRAIRVKVMETPEVANGERCSVVRGTHAGKSGKISGLKTSKTGHVTITVVQANGERFKTLARNVLVKGRKNG